MCPGPGVCWRDFAHALSKYIFIPCFFFTTSADFALVIRYLWSNFPLTRLTLSHMNTGWFLLTGHLHISVTHTVLRSPVYGNKQKQLKQTHVTTTHNVLQAHAWRFWALWRVNVAAGWLAGRQEEELVHERSHESEDLLKSRLQQQGARVITVFNLHPFSSDNVRSWRSQKKRDRGNNKSQHALLGFHTCWYPSTVRPPGPNTAKQKRGWARFFRTEPMYSMSYATKGTKTAHKYWDNTEISIDHWLGVNYQPMTLVKTKRVIWATQTQEHEHASEMRRSFMDGEWTVEQTIIKLNKENTFLKSVVRRYMW